MKEHKGSENLVSLGDRTAEERREIGRMGGIKSGETKRRRKTLREDLLAVLGTEVKNKKGENVTLQKSMIDSLIVRAINGNVKAFEVIRDTIGEKPVERQEITGFINQSEASVEEVQEFREKLGIK